MYASEFATPTRADAVFPSIFSWQSYTGFPCERCASALHRAAAISPCAMSMEETAPPLVISTIPRSTGLILPTRRILSDHPPLAIAHPAFDGSVPFSRAVRVKVGLRVSYDWVLAPSIPNQAAAE